MAHMFLSFSFVLLSVPTLSCPLIRRINSSGRQSHSLSYILGHWWIGLRFCKDLIHLIILLENENYLNIRNSYRAFFPGLRLSGGALNR
jgi:hypothetical protein